MTNLPTNDIFGAPRQPMTTEYAVKVIKSAIWDGSLTASEIYRALVHFDATSHDMAHRITSNHYPVTMATIDTLALAAFSLMSDNDKAIDLAEAHY